LTARQPNFHRSKIIFGNCVFVISSWTVLPSSYRAVAKGKSIFDLRVPRVSLRVEPNCVSNPDRGRLSQETDADDRRSCYLDRLSLTAADPFGGPAAPLADIDIGEVRFGSRITVRSLRRILPICLRSISKHETVLDVWIIVRELRGKVHRTPGLNRCRVNNQFDQRHRSPVRRWILRRRRGLNQNRIRVIAGRRVEVHYLGLVHFLLRSIAKIDRDGETRIPDEAGRRERERHFIAEWHPIPIDVNANTRNSRLSRDHAWSNVDCARLLPDHSRATGHDCKQRNG
jgi:hypothetical protein